MTFLFRLLSLLALLLTPAPNLFGKNPGVSPRPMVEMEGMPDSFYCGCVNVISGGYCDYELDINVPGPLPLKVERVYSSSTTFESGDQFTGWSDLFKLHMRCNWKVEETWLGLGEDKRELKGVSCAETSGTNLYYDWWIEKQGKNKVPTIIARPENFHKGFTNCGASLVAGRTHIKNNVLKFSSKLENCLLTTSSGEQRFYNKVSKQPDYKVLEWLYQPDGNQMRWSYDHDTITRWWTCDSSRSHEYASASYSEHKLQTVITTSDGRQRISSYFAPKDYLYKWLYLTEVVRSDRPTVKYDYDKKYDDNWTYPIIRKIYPDQRVLGISYYKAGHNKVRGEKIKLVEKSTRKNRVLALHAPVGKDASLIPIGWFFYSHIPEGQLTDVYDAHDNLTSYFIDGNDRLNKIRYYKKEGNGQVCKKEERFAWSGDGSLLSTEYLDDKSALLQRIDYSYDGKGNVLTKALTGCFTGRTDQPEHVIHSYAYSDQMSLLVRQTDPSGLVTTITYYPGTNLVQSKLKTSNGEVIQREFMRYNGDAVLIEQISDDGSGTAPEDLTDVINRKIVRFTPRTQQPCWGLPTVEEELYWENGQEKLLKRTEREYDLGGRVTSERVYGADGLFAYSKAWVYDAHGNCLLERDALGQEIHRTYDANDNMLTEEGPRPGVRTVCKYDFSNRLTEKRLEGPGEVYVEQYGYNYLGQKISAIDSSGNETHFAYDRFGNCIRKVSPPIFNKNPDGSVEVLELVEDWTYNALGQMVEATDTQGLTTKFAYTTTGEKTRVDYPDGTYEQFYYTLDGKIEEEWSRTGVGKRYDYDSWGRRIKEELLDRNQESVATLSYIYVRSQLQKVIDCFGNETLYFYDGAGRLTREQRIDAKGTCVAEASRAYDSLGRVCKEVQGTGEEATVTVVERDLLDHVIEQRVETVAGEVQQRVRITYDEVGNPTAVLKEGIHATTTNYDLKNRPISVVDPVGGETLITYDEQYLNETNQKILRKETRDPLGQLQIAIHNSRGEPVRVETYTPEGETCGVQETAYRKDKNPKTVLQRVYSKGEEIRSVVAEWGYDAFGRITSIADGKGTEEETVTRKSYTPYGELSVVMRPNGITLTHLYDSLGRLISLVSSDESIHYLYRYDAVGNLLEMEDSIHGTSTKRSYDALKRIVREELQNGFVVERAFDLQGRVTKTTYSNGKELAYAYQASELREVQGKGKGTYKAFYSEYNLSGQLTTYQGVGNSGTEHFSYDELGRFLTQEGPLFSEQVEGYDLAGNIDAITTQDPLGSRMVDYQYGAKYQLIKEGSEHSYQYDSLSNRLEKDGNQEKINALNQVLKAGATSCEYDRNGNLVRLSGGEVDWTFTYDALDRLIVASGIYVEAEVGVEITYLYDGFNRCVGRTEDMELAYHGRGLGRKSEISSVFYLYDGIREIGSKDEKGITQEFRFLSPAGKAIAMELPSGTYAPIYNFRGDLVVLADPKTGRAKATTRYSAFGEETGSTLSPWRFQNKRVDPITGLSNFGRRWYSPTLARWITRDPLGYDAGPNLYTYVDNRPLLFVDVQGLFKEAIFDGIAKDSRKKGPERSRSLNNSNEPSILGQFFYHNCYPTSGIYTVPGRKVDDMHVLFVNGMCYSWKEAEQATKRISETFGDIEVDFLYGSSHGFIPDLMESAFGLLGIYPSHTAREEIRYVNERYNNAKNPENLRIFVFAHSQGGIVQAEAAPYIDKPIRKQMRVFTFGSGTLIEEGTYGTADNYVRNGDPVGTSSASRLKIRQQISGSFWGGDLYGEKPVANLRMVGDPKALPSLREHAFEAYQDCVKEVYEDNARLFR